MEEHYIWLFNKSDKRGLFGAAFCSLLLHVLMVVVMATTSIFYPTAGDASKIDVVWLYPFLFGGETDTPPPAQSSPEMTEPVSPAREVIAPPAGRSSRRLPHPPSPLNRNRHVKQRHPLLLHRLLKRRPSLLPPLTPSR